MDPLPWPLPGGEGKLKKTPSIQCPSDKLPMAFVMGLFWGSKQNNFILDCSSTRRLKALREADEHYVEYYVPELPDWALIEIAKQQIRGSPISTWIVYTGPWPGKPL